MVNEILFENTLNMVNIINSTNDKTRALSPKKIPKKKTNAKTCSMYFRIKFIVICYVLQK